MVSLVAGQENYGLAIVCVAEAIWSFVQAPSLDQVVKILVPAVVAAAVLGLVSGPMITTTTNANVSDVGVGLWIATGVSALLAASYVARLIAPSSYSPSPPKEIAGLGLLVSLAGLVSFAQNLVVNGFVQLPSVDLPF